MSLYMVIENFRNGDARPVYRRFRDRGRLAPAGLTYVSSWVTDTLDRCYQLMETEDRQLLDQWMATWSDIVDFEVHAVMSSNEARRENTPGAVNVHLRARNNSVSVIVAVSTNDSGPLLEGHRRTG